MGLKIQLIALTIGIIFFLGVLRYIKRNSFNPGQSVLWIILCLFFISIPLLEPLYKWIATNIIGISDARHIIYIFIIGFLLVYIFYLSSKVTKMSDQIQNLISFTAILEKEIRDKNGKKG
jgi:hypothetical protein